MLKIKLYDTLYHIPDVESEVTARSGNYSAVVVDVGRGFVDVVVAGGVLNSYLIPDFATLFVVDSEPLEQKIKTKGIPSSFKSRRDKQKALKVGWKRTHTGSYKNENYPGWEIDGWKNFWHAYKFNNLNFHFVKSTKKPLKTMYEACEYVKDYCD